MQSALTLDLSDDEDDLIAPSAPPAAEDPAAIAYVEACSKANSTARPRATIDPDTGEVVVVTPRSGGGHIARCSQWHRACVSRAAEVSLSHYGLGARAVQPLAESLAINQHIVALDLGDNGLGAEGVQAVLGALAPKDAAPKLRSLSLRQNQAGEDGATALGEMLSLGSHRLVSIDFGSNSIGDKGATYVADGLARNDALTTLVLDHNDIEAEGAAKLAQALAESNRCLTSLSLEWNSVGAEGARALADALKLQQPTSGSGVAPSACPLRLLNLGWNGLGDAGVSSLALAIHSRPAGCPSDHGVLRDVRLHHNRATVAAALALSKALVGLDVLDVCGNPLGAEGASVLILAQQREEARRLDAQPPSAQHGVPSSASAAAAAQTGDAEARAEAERTAVHAGDDAGAADAERPPGDAFTSEGEGAAAQRGAEATSAAGVAARCRIMMEDVCVRPDAPLAHLLRNQACRGDDICSADLESSGVHAAAALAHASGPRRESDANGKGAGGGAGGRGKQGVKGEWVRDTRSDPPRAKGTRPGGKQ